MAAEDRIKAINAEAKARENLKKVETDLAKVQAENAKKSTAYTRQEIRNLEEKKRKVEAYLEKVEGIKDAADAFKDTADNISLSSRATSQLSSAISNVVKNYKAISSIDLGTPENQKEAATSFIKDFQEGASMMQNAQAELMNASNEEERTIALDNIEAAKKHMKSLAATHAEFLGQNAAANNFLQDYIRGTQSVNEQIKVTSGLTAEQVEQYKELTAEADKMSTRMKAVGDQITTAFRKPNVLIGLMFVGLGKVADVVGKTTREMGGFVGGLTGATAQVSALSVVFPTALDSAKGLSSEFGGLADTSFETQVNTNLMAMNMGVSGKEAAQLVGQFARLNDGSVGTAENLIASTKELAKQKGLVPSSVMADVAGSAQAFAEYGKAGGKNIAEAAVAAGQLGINLDSATKVTDHLLDFENSINQELELGARLGKNINFQKARELAYQGDIRGSLQAALQQMGGIDAFNRMDVFQKRAAAAALGLSTDELQKMLSNMDKLNKDGSIQVSQFDQMKEALTGFATGFGGQLLKSIGLFTMALPFLKDGFASMWSTIKGIGSGIAKIAGGLKDAVVSSAKFLTNLVKIAAQKLGFGGAEAGAALNPFEVAKSKGLSDKQILSGFGGKEAKDMMQVPESVTDKAKDSITDKVEDKITDKVENVELPDKALPKSSFGDKLKDLSEGLSSMGTTKVLFGALNLIPTGIGFVGLVPGIPGMLAVGAFGKLAGKGLQGLAEGLVAMTPTIAGSTSLLIAALAFTAMIPGSVGMLLMGAAAPIASFGIYTLIPALTALGTLMSSGVGALGLAALIGLSVGLGAAFALIGAGAMMFGKGIELASNSLGSFLPKLSTFMESISLGQIGAIGLLSLAFIGLAGSLMLLGAAGLFALPSLLGIAAAASGIAIVAELFGLGGEGKAEETTALESESASTFEKDVLGKIDQLISAVSNGMQVNLDGRQVSIGLERTSGRSLQNNALVRGE